MTDKYFIYLVLITISLFFLAFISFLIQPRYETSIKRGEIIFENIKNQLNDIKEINIDNNKNKISIIKDEDNWNMISKSGYMVKNEVVRKNLIQISELRFFEKKTKEKSLYSRLNLDYPNDEDGDSKFITIKNSDKETLIEFVLGKKKNNGVYIKQLKDKQTWLTSGSLDMSSIEKDWLETKILDVNYDDVKKISLNHSNTGDSFSLTKDEKNENLLIDNLSKEQIPKSDLIANYLGYFFTNLFFDDVAKRKNAVDNKIITKISASIFNENTNKWINFNIDSQHVLKLKNNGKIFINDINNWSYKLPSTKYNVSGAKLSDLLVEN